MSGRAIARALDISDRQLRRYLAEENYPEDDKIEKFLAVLDQLESNASFSETNDDV